MARDSACTQPVTDNQTAQQELPRCRECAHVMPASALKCSKCQSFQDWRRYLAFSSTALSLVIAFLSILTVAVPVLLNAVGTNNSSASIEFLPQKTSSEIQLLVRNTGSRPAMIREIEFTLGETNSIVNNGVGDVIEPGAFEIRPVAIPIAPDRTAKASNNVRILLQQFDGTTSEFSSSFTLP